jgi:hypothetical protein
MLSRMEESFIEVINEGAFEQDASDFIQNQKLILDACKCTGNCRSD